MADLFSTQLARCMTPNYSPMDWAEILGSELSETTVKSWYYGEAVPPAKYLRVIVTLVTDDTRVSKQDINRLEEILQLPLREATDLWRQFDQDILTLRHYMVTPLIEAFLRTLKTLPAIDQERALFSCSHMVRSMREEPSK